jgi:hypothetical protein
MKKISEAAQWTLLTTAGLGGGILTALLVGKPIGKIVGAMLVTAILTALVGAVLGGMQAVWLRRLVARPVRWIAATTGGVGIGLALGVVAIEQTGIFITGERPHVLQLSSPMRALSFLALGVITGLALGIAQWLVLHVRHWVITSAAGLAVAFTAASLLVDASLGGIASPAGLIAFVVISGALFGAATSLPLLKKRAADEPPLV